MAAASAVEAKIRAVVGVGRGGASTQLAVLLVVAQRLQPWPMSSSCDK